MDEKKSKDFQEKKKSHCPIKFFGEGEEWRREVIRKIAADVVEEQLPEKTVSPKLIEPEVKKQSTEKKELTYPVYFTATVVNPDGTLEEGKVAEENQGRVILKPGVTPEVLKKIPYEKLYPYSSELQIVRAEEKQKKENEEKEIIGANYRLEPVLKELYYDREGKEVTENNQILVQIVFELPGVWNRTERFMIRAAEISSITSVVGKRYSYATIGDSKDKVLLENNFRMKTYGIPEVRCYEEGGWHKIDGRHVYLYQGATIPNARVLTNLSLPHNQDIYGNAVVEIFMDALSLYKDTGVAYTLIVYSFLGILYKVFDEAGYPPHFLLFMNGKTGSYKTSIAKVLFTQLADEQYRKYPRRIEADTPTSLEIGLVKCGADTVTLLDDYAPAKTLKQQSNQTANLEMVIRMVGDGSSKSRSNSNLEDVRGAGLKGMVVITGELKGKGLSSNLRCLYLDIQKELVNETVLSLLQSKEFCYTTLIKLFTDYVSETWDFQVNRIQSQYESARNVARNYVQTGRLTDTLVTLWLTFDIVAEFLEQYGNWSDRLWMETAKSEVALTVQKSEQISVEEEPASLFMKMMIQMINAKKLIVVPYKDKLSVLKCADGYFDNGYYYLLPETVYRKVVYELRTTNGYFPLELDQLTKALCDEKFIVPINNGAGKRTYYARVDLGTGKKIKFLKVNKKVFERLENDM